jgi:hypothetical protein
MFVLPVHYSTYVARGTGGKSLSLLQRYSLFLSLFNDPVKLPMLQRVEREDDYVLTWEGNVHGLFKILFHGKPQSDGWNQAR